MQPLCLPSASSLFLAPAFACISPTCNSHQAAHALFCTQETQGAWINIFHFQRRSTAFPRRDDPLVLRPNPPVFRCSFPLLWNLLSCHLFRKTFPVTPFVPITATLPPAVASFFPMKLNSPGSSTTRISLCAVCLPVRPDTLVRTLCTAVTGQ